MRILLLAHNQVGVGSYLRFSGFAKGLAEIGHDVLLIAPARGVASRMPIGHPVNDNEHWTKYLLGERIANGGLDPFDIASRLILLKDQEFDVVHASEHRPAASLPALFARKRQGTTYISDWADLWGQGGIMDGRHWLQRLMLGRMEDWAERRVHQVADAITTPSQELFSRALRLGHVDGRILLIRNSVDTRIFTPSEISPTSRRKHGLPEDEPLLAYAGQADLDLDLLLAVYLEVLRERPDCYLLLLGGVDLPRKKLEGHEDRIINLGYLPLRHYATVLSLADVLLLPYRQTSRNLGRWPGKLAYYMAVGRPIVANPTGAVGRILARGAGIQAPQAPTEFARVVLGLLEDPGLQESLGHRAREIAVAQFDVRAAARELAHFYHVVLNRGH
jgi:glycosyltransferase involved in cell wall biosynthesis